jgi:hypothetical protein
MTIQRQYSLPNCTLTLEGFGDGSGNAFDLRPVMSILTSAECKLMGQVLRGGKDFLEGLMNAASLYAQEVLSGIHVPSESAGAVSLQRLGPDQHQLTFQPETGEAQTATLNTVQLFDLVEAIDQFIADTQTLPNWSPGLRPASKRFAPKEPVSKQAVPIAAGLGSLALAAAAFAALPTPQIKQPSDLTYGATPTAAASPSPTPSPTTSPTSSPSAAVSPSPTASPAASPNPDGSLPEITDNKEIERLGGELEKQLLTNFKPDSPVTQAVAYRVSMAKDGKIIGYRPDDTAASDFVNQTPLPKLAFIPAPGGAAPTDPIASLRATFFPDGTVKVTPWNAPAPQASASPTASPTATVAVSPSPEASPSPSATASPAATTAAAPGQEILEPAKLKELQPKLYDTIDAQWKTANFKEDLTFLVRVNGEGKILEYKPKGQAATDFAAETPLPQLGKVNDSDNKPQEAYAAFKVVFTPEGKLQINPWAGYAEGQ